MSTTASLSRACRVYVWCVILAGGAAIAASFGHLATAPVPPQWALLGVLAAVSGAAVLRLRVANATFSIGDTFSFAALFLYGPAAATVTMALDALAISVRLHSGRLHLPRLLFNVAAPALAMWVAGLAPFDASQFATAAPLTERVVPLLSFIVVSAALFFLVQSAFVATAVALERSEPPLTVWREHFVGLWTPPFAGAYVGALLAFFTRDLSGSLAVLLLPLPLLLYFAFRSWLGRVDAEMQHLADMGRAYHAMIRAFATAIDAKDQVTHGHIQRVQIYALMLARALGVTDEKELKALEAAALLHDLGKIGIPDQILNKPGRLTPAEYDEMKQHVVIGTDILANIEFPYPVVPIVRHHHENWDGQGYPDGLRGAAIPIGARILAVVDCFDALTSDRPYRSRMSVADAFKIIMERRGTMYDPEVVDTFRRVQPHVHVPDNQPVESVLLRHKAASF